MVRPRAPWTEPAAVRGAVANGLCAAARIPTLPAVLGTVAALIAVAALDHYAGRDWSLGLFYYLPVAFAAWRLGRNFALTAGFLLSIGWLVLVQGGAMPAPPGLSLYWSFGMHLLSFGIVAVLVSEMRDLFERERTIARYCHLTGALTGRAFRDVLEQSAAQARRRSTGTALIYVDMDDFKKVNDRLGHAAGDAALEVFARAVRAQLGPDDHFARTGGDEFVIFLAGREGPAARTAIERIRSAALAALAEDGSGVSASMGAIIVPPGRAVDPGDLVRRADAAMYEAKRGGKGSLAIRTLGEAATLQTVAA